MAIPAVNPGNPIGKHIPDRNDPVVVQTRDLAEHVAGSRADVVIVRVVGDTTAAGLVQLTDDDIPCRGVILRAPPLSMGGPNTSDILALVLEGGLGSDPGAGDDWYGTGSVIDGEETSELFGTVVPPACWEPSEVFVACSNANQIWLQGFTAGDTIRAFCVR